MTVLKDFPLALSWCTPFFLQTLFSWRNLQNKTMQNGCYSQNDKICPFCFANFSKKTWSTEKIKYTTTKPTENLSKSHHISDAYSLQSSIHFASICFANFSIKTRSTEKMEYTTTKPTENPLKLYLNFFIFETLSQRFFVTK